MIHLGFASAGACLSVSASLPLLHMHATFLGRRGVVLQGRSSVIVLWCPIYAASHIRALQSGEVVAMARIQRIMQIGEGGPFDRAFLNNSAAAAGRHRWRNGYTSYLL